MPETEDTEAVKRPATTRRRWRLPLVICSAVFASGQRCDPSDPTEPSAIAEPAGGAADSTTTRAYRKIEPTANPATAFEPKLTPRPIAPKNPMVNALAAQVGAKLVPIETPCAQGTPEDCSRWALDRFYHRLDQLVETRERSVRILQLGDSHIAADYITKTARLRLQGEFGTGGRGFIHPEQHASYGGRRLKRGADWKRSRVVDPGQEGQPFGFSGIAIEAVRRGDKVQYSLRDDSVVEVVYLARRGGGTAEVTVDGRSVGQIDARADRPETRGKRFSIPPRDSTLEKDARVFQIQATSPGLRIFGLSFVRKKAGIILDAVGPVGTDAYTYLAMEEDSFGQTVEFMDPDLVIIMLGGNDALRIRTGRATLADVRGHFEALVDRVRASVPAADCMLWSPMDAGERVRGEIVQRSYIEEVRQLQAEVARAKGCAYWDMYEAMGGRGSIQRWYEANIINKDLIHPRFKAGLLLGHLFASSLLDDYDGS